MKLTRRHLRRLIVESLEDRIHGGPDVDMTGWELIPDDELHSALSGAIWDLHMYVHGVRPRWMDLENMSIVALENLHSELEAALAGVLQADQQREDEMKAAQDLEVELQASAQEEEHELPKYGSHSRRVNEFAGATRMARGGSSPMKSRADPEFARMIKKSRRR